MFWNDESLLPQVSSFHGLRYPTNMGGLAKHGV